MTQAAETPTPVNVLAANGKPKIIGFVCEWSLGRTDLIFEDGTVKGMEHIKTIKIPCSGFVKTEWVTLAFENGAQGVFVLGCPLGDCHFNEGNFIINERLSQHVGRLVNRKTIDDDGRVAELYLGATQNDEFTKMLADFTGYIQALPALAPPQKKAKKAAPAAAKAAAPAAAEPTTDGGAS
jgi:coenzyme F420-reducing hydrogenase delta subunit